MIVKNKYKFDPSQIYNLFEMSITQFQDRKYKILFN